MNTSANTNRFLRRCVAGALLTAGISATTVGLAAPSRADMGDQTPNFASPGHANCTTDPWGFLGSQRRTLCDGPIASDGSWSRERTIWAPAHYTSRICSSLGSDLYSSCYGGYFVDERLISDETYPVRPDTVLPDEPGHLS